MKSRVAFLSLAFCTLLAQAALAQSDVGFKRGGVAIGMVSPENGNTTLGLGVFADMGTIAPRWGLETRLDWWGNSESAFGFDASMNDYTLGARTKYAIPTTNTNIRPFMGGGLGIHFLSTKVTTTDPFTGQKMSATASENRLGLDLGGGFATNLNPSTDVLAEAWYGFVSDVNQFSLRLGLSHSFGN